MSSTGSLIVLSRVEGAPSRANRASAALREAQLASARQLLAELRYVRRFAEEIAAFEDD